MGEVCEVCGAPCPLVEHWYMGGAPGEYEEAMAAHWRLGYERSQAALAAARRALALIESCGHTPCNHIAREALASPAAGEEG